MQAPENIFILIEKYQSGTISPEEKFMLDKWYRSFDDTEAKLTGSENDSEQQLADRIKSRLLNTIDDNYKPVIKKRPLIRRISAAAAILILVAITTYFISPSKLPKELIVKTQPIIQKLKNDIAPGGNKAILTLADGSAIVLDSASNGTISQQGNVEVRKLDNGLLAYEKNGQQVTENDEAFFNTISTPRGGQYNVTLADGTRVWLNAASSIRFPVVFTGAERTVEITGEAYFEVTTLTAGEGQRKVPFIVKIKTSLGNGEQVKVLGTHFNVNAYDDEAITKTTLLEGRVQVTTNNMSAMLLPGQQAQMNEKGKLILVNDADPQEVLAWKDGLFVMKRAGIGSIMRQIARWYNVDIVYQGEVPPGRISGDIPRNMNLSKVLKVMELSGVHFTIDGKKVMVKS
ncbi:MAG: FecR domain-containing protein [Ginsengibacter sp.]